MRGTDHPASETDRPPVSVPSRPRTRAGAASAVLLVVLGVGTLGALPPAPVVHGQGRLAADTTLSSATADDNTVTAASTPGALLPVAPLAPAVDIGIPVLPAPDVAAEPEPPAVERPAPFTTDLPDQRAQVAINTAMAQLGLPYVWGGNGPTNGDAGFDCSGLTTFSYAAAGVGLPRTAHTQYYTGPHVPPGAALQPGDLVFYGTPARVHHVGMYLGEGKMINAPTFGKPVQVAFYRYGGDDYLGATRPASNGTSTGLLPYAPPAPPRTDVPRSFPAPVAPRPTAVPQVTSAQPPEAVSAARAQTAAAAVAPTTPTGETPTSTAPTSSEPTSTAPTTEVPPSTVPSVPPSSAASAPPTTPSTAPPASTTTTTSAPPSTTTTTATPPVTAAEKPTSTATPTAQAPAEAPPTSKVTPTRKRAAATKPAAASSSPAPPSSRSAAAKPARTTTVVPVDDTATQKKATADEDTAEKDGPTAEAG